MSVGVGTESVSSPVQMEFCVCVCVCAHTCAYTGTYEDLGISGLRRLPRWCSGKESACQCKRHKGRGVGKIHWEEEMATLSSILAWRIPWTEEHDGLQSMGSQRVRHN